jgi:hypothetical protein
LTVLCLLVLLAPLMSLPANDLGWQLKAGEIISRTGSVPRVDTLSWTSRGEPWLVHEWLVCCLMYQLFTHVGPAALVALKLCLLWTTFLLIYLLARRRSGSTLVGAAATLAAAYCGRVFWDARPQLVTYLMLALWMLLLDHWRYGAEGSAEGQEPTGADGRRRWLLWSLPPLTLLWANCHAGVGLGPLLLALCLAGWWLDDRLGRHGQSPARGYGEAWICWAACVLVTLVNPHGIGLWLYPFRLASHPQVFTIITEWFSPVFRSSALHWYEALVLATPLALAAGWQLRDRGTGRLASVVDLLLVAGTLHLSLLAVRHVPLFGLVAAPTLAGHLPAIGKWVAAQLGLLGESCRRGATAIAAAAFLVVGAPSAAIIADGVPWRYLPGWSLGSASFPDRAVAYLKTAGYPGPLWNEYRWGGHLIWTLPEYPVFVDGRAEVYYRTSFDDFCVLHRLEPRWKRVLDSRGINLVLVDRKMPLSRALDLCPDWTLSYSDTVARLYRRRSPILRPHSAP